MYQSSYLQSSQSPDVTFTGTNDRGRHHVERVRNRSLFPRHQNQTLSPSDLRNYSLQVRVEIRPGGPGICRDTSQGPRQQMIVVLYRS